MSIVVSDTHQIRLTGTEGRYITWLLHSWIMSEAEVYNKTPRSTVNRLKQRAVYDHDTVHNIIDTAPVAHVSFNPVSRDDDPFPAILPMLACTGSYTAPDATETSPIAIYLHGHAASRFFRLSNSENEDGLPGVPVCVAATLFDGVVLAYTPFNHSCNYRSAVIHGFAQPVEDPEEKAYALERITDALIPGRWAHTRVPPTPAELRSTSVIRVDIASASAKVRAYSAGNDAADLGNAEVREKVWTGVVPASIQYGTPVAARENEVEKVPEHVVKWVEDENKTGEEYSSRVASLAGPGKT